MPPERGQTAVVVPVPAAEPIVSRWRADFDSSAAQGMPAHITALYPFLAESRLTGDVVAQLQALCGERDAPEVTFVRSARFPGLLYLDPEPADGLRELSLAIADRWPEAPLYGGVHDEVIPHLTVACADEAILDAVEADLRPRLPLQATLEDARLYAFDGVSWKDRARLPFQRRPGTFITAGAQGPAGRTQGVDIRRLGRGDGDQLRGVRLRALADAPYAFSSSLDREAGLGPGFWTDRVAESELGKDGVVFVAADGDQSLGMAGGFFVDEGHTVAMLWGMWVDPRARRGGLGRALVEAVAGWARESGAHSLRLAVTDCEASKPAAALYQELDFVETGEREPLEWNALLITRILSRPT